MKLTPQQILRTSRVIVYKRHRFFMVPLFKLREVADPTCPSLSVDAGLRLYYNPERLAEWGVEFVPTFLAHEIQHILRGHPARMEAWLARNKARCAEVWPAVQALWPGIKDPYEMFNVAEDAEINDEMDAAGWLWPPGFAPIRPSTMMPSGEALPDGKTGEFYAAAMLDAAEALMKQVSPSAAQGAAKSGPGSGDCNQEGGGDDDATDAEAVAGQDNAEGGGRGEPRADSGEPRDDGAGPEGDDERDDGARPEGEDDADGPENGQGSEEDRARDGDGGGGASGVEAGGSPAVGQGGCGGCCGNRGGHENLDDPNLPDPASANDLDLIRRRVALDLEEMRSGDGRGSGAGDFWFRWSQSILKPPKVDWRQVLAKRVRGAVTAARARVDWKYGPPSRRREVLRHIMGDEAPLLPVLRGPSPQVVFVVDVSGSMMGPRVKRAFSEVLGISRACSHVPCAGIAVDAGVQGIVKKVRTAEDLMKLNKGGGGTDMRVGIKAASELKPAPEVIIVVSDGETPWPSRSEMPKKAEVVVCVVNRNRHYFDSLPEHFKRAAVLVGEDGDDEQ